MGDQLVENEEKADVVAEEAWKAEEAVNVEEAKAKIKAKIKARKRGSKNKDAKKKWKAVEEDGALKENADYTGFKETTQIHFDFPLVDQTWIWVKMLEGKTKEEVAEDFSSKISSFPEVKKSRQFKTRED